MTDAEKIKGKERDDDFSSSDSEDERPVPPASSSVAAPAVTEARSKIYHLFGREKPIHHVLGGGASADAFLWRNKKVSGAVVGVVTALWILFELAEYHLLTLVSHSVILALVVLFLYSIASTFINKTPPRLPEVYIPEDIIVGIALAIRQEINNALFFLREIALGRDLKKFLGVIAGLLAVSFVGEHFNFLTLFFLAIVLLFTVPFVYEKYEDKVDAFAEKAKVEIKKHYAMFDERVLSKIPRGPAKEKKH